MSVFLNLTDTLNRSLFTLVYLRKILRVRSILTRHVSYRLQGLGKEGETCFGANGKKERQKVRKRGSDVYFDQHLGAAHSKTWSKSCILDKVLGTALRSLQIVW